MEFNANPQQNSSHLHNSTTVWTQPSTDEQRRYYSKHAAEKRVFGWITTLLQTAHGAIAFAAWTAIYIWIFKSVPFMLPTAPFIAGATLISLHILFRTTWQTFWYDKLDNDPNTDSPVWVPVAIFILLITLEVQGAKQYLAGQVSPVAEKNTAQIDSDHSTTIASIEQTYRNTVASINEVYKAKTAPIDRQIASARNRSADTDAERRNRSARIATLQAQRDAILSEKAAEIKKAFDECRITMTNANARRDQAIAVIDTHNAGELARYTAEMGSVSTYAWVLSLGLLFLIAGLSYRTVRINVKSGIIPLRNYTVLDAHGSIPERIWTALTDALNRRTLQLAVWMHRRLSPNQAITSFDGTVVARPGTYNTPEGFYPNPSNPDTDHILRQKVADKLLREAAKGEIRLTPELLELEFQKARTMNGSYSSTPLGKNEPSPANTARPAEGPSVAPHPARNSVNSENSGNSDPDEPRYIALWRKMMLGHIEAYDRAMAANQPGQAHAHQEALNDTDGAAYKLGRRLGLSWGIHDGDIHVWRDRTPHIRVRLSDLTPAALDGTTPSGSGDIASETDELFKQNPNLFKQKIVAHKDDAGKVIGIKYLKKDNTWTTYDYNTVRGQYRIYHQRAQKGEISQAVADGLEKWEYAMSLFAEGREELERENIQVIQ